MRRTKKRKIPKDKTKRQLVEAADKLLSTIRARNQRVAELEDQLTHGDRLRREGEHWYQICDYFDPEAIRAYPGADDTFIMGMLRSVLVIQVPSGSTPEQLQHLEDGLRRFEISSPILFVQEGVAFLRIATVDEELEAMLDTQIRTLEKAYDEKPSIPDAPATDDARDGSVPTGHRLGDPLPALVGTAGDGSDRDETPVEAGQEAANGL